MPQSKILVDTNTYIRLAQGINPLLSNQFGDEEYCLYILKEAHQELLVQRLAKTHHWINEVEFLENRQSFPQIGRKQKREITENFGYMWEDAQEEFIGPSKVDVIYLATGLALNIPVVTDDKAMRALGLEHEVDMMSTMELLKLMFECDYISMKTVDGLIHYWIAFNDRPGDLGEDYERLFDAVLTTI
jgi:predicted nucleic acid-binding protein